MYYVYIFFDMFVIYEAVLTATHNLCFGSKLEKYFSPVTLRLSI